MRYRTLGGTGILVSEVGFGAWAIGGPARLGKVEVGWGKVDDSESIRTLEKALDLGVNFIDTADVYGAGHSEELIGRVTQARREEVVIATKYGNRTDESGEWVKDFSSSWARESLEGSLKRLRTDHVDLLLMHTPFPQQDFADIEEGVAEMERLKGEGKVRHWGISINPVAHGIEAIRRGWRSAIEVVFNALERDSATELFPAAKCAGIGIIARVPLASGLLTGKFKKGTVFSPDDHRRHSLSPEKLEAAIEKVEKLRPLAAERGITLAQLALLYVLAHDAVSVVIPGAKSPAQAEDNTVVANLPPLTSDEKKAVEEAIGAC